MRQLSSSTDQPPPMHSQITQRQTARREAQSQNTPDGICRSAGARAAPCRGGRVSDAPAISRTHPTPPAWSSTLRRQVRTVPVRQGSLVFFLGSSVLGPLHPGVYENLRPLIGRNAGDRKKNITLCSRPSCELVFHWPITNKWQLSFTGCVRSLSDLAVSLWLTKTDKSSNVSLHCF